MQRNDQSSSQYFLLSQNGTNSFSFAQQSSSWNHFKGHGIIREQYIYIYIYIYKDIDINQIGATYSWDKIERLQSLCHSCGVKKENSFSVILTAAIVEEDDR